MKRNFHLAPPDFVTVELFDRSRDVNGNPTAHYLLMWSNGLTGADCESGHHRTARRVQVGYSDKATPGATGVARDLFPGTQWEYVPGTYRETRTGCTFDLARDHDAESVPVIFRAEKSGTFKNEVTAIFPTLAGTGPGDVTIYARVGQHSTGSRGWYRETRAATPDEYAALKRELESAPFNYRLDVVKRWTPKHDEIRAAIYHAERGAV